MSQLIKERHRLQLHLSEPERITLQEAVHHPPRPNGRERCAALLKVAEGYSPPWVARHGLLMRRDPDSLYQCCGMCYCLLGDIPRTVIHVLPFATTERGGAL